MMTKPLFKNLLFIIFFALGTYSYAQVGIGTTNPNTNAMLDIDVSSLSADAKKGFMPPRMTTTEKNTLGGALGSTDKGMLVFDTDNVAYYYWNGTEWLLLRIDTVITDEDSFGNMYLVSPTNTLISSKDVPVKIEGITATEGLKNFETDGNNRLKYIGTSTRTFSVVCSMSFASSDKNDTCSFYLYQGGNAGSPGIISSSKVRRFIAAANDVGALSVSGLVSLAPNEWIEIWGEDNTSGGLNLKVGTFNLLIY